MRLTSTGWKEALLPADSVAQCARVTPVAMPLAARPTRAVMPSVQAVDRTVRSFVHSLASMRERAALYGGTATAGPGYEGGWTVTATIPVLKRGAR